MRRLVYLNWPEEKRKDFACLQLGSVVETNALLSSLLRLDKIRGRQDEAEFDMSIVINLSLLLFLFTNVCVNPVLEQLVL